MGSDASQHETVKDAIVESVLRRYHGLPSKYKPLRDTNGVNEWVPLAGIVFLKEARPICISACTGAKSLPQSKLSGAQGRVLHDCHAEILAIRAMNAVLLREVSRLVSDDHETSDFVSRRDICEIGPEEPQLFQLCKDIKIYMYCSEAPCGDASMELIMEDQTDATPWSSSPSGNEETLMGRSNFDQLGIVRRKPARPDAPVCLSKSCTDKLSLRQCTSLLHSASSMFIHPARAYLAAVILPRSRVRQVACERAFGSGGRLKALTHVQWPGGYAFRPFTVCTTDRVFEFSREAVQQSCKVSNKSAIAMPHMQEVLVNGLVQGRKLEHPASTSILARRRMWLIAFALASKLGMSTIDVQTGVSTYAQSKSLGVSAAQRQRVKRAVVDVLGSWPLNTGDDFPLQLTTDQ